MSSDDALMKIHPNAKVTCYLPLACARVRVWVFWCVWRHLDAYAHRATSNLLFFFSLCECSGQLLHATLMIYQLTFLVST